MHEHLRAARPRSEDGASSVEYGLLIFLVAAIIVLAVLGLGMVTKGNFQNSCDEIEGTGVLQAAANCDGT